MLTYRTFKNFDPPTLASLWRSRAGQPGLWQPVSPDLLEQLVFAKLYFDYQGLWLASEDGQTVGFAHAGFGPNADRTGVSTDAGVICLALLQPGPAEAEVADGLFDRCEQYLRQRGARTIQGGGVAPRNPFYTGLYGGSELPGVLDSDATVRSALAARGYREVEQVVLLQRDLNGFEALIDRRQMQIRRQTIVEVTIDAPTQTWWDACTVGEFDLTRFDLVPRTGDEPIASATFRSMEPSGTTSAGRAVGLINITVAEPYRRRGLAIFLLSEAFRQFLRLGITQVDAQLPKNDSVLPAMFQKLGFHKVQEGGVWQKT
ncbi:MAG: GNAT family N-acetyltransferase [Planctomycetaceae bacterium]|nr:GNAT family N-acetyltransferase [Planctomycetaceae bacterium]